MKTATLSDKKQFTPDVIELTFTTAEPFNFQAGQFVTLKIADQTPPCFRAYSISSCPQDNGNSFSTCLKIINNGRGSNWLNKLQIGDEINFIGPSGKFTFKNVKNTALFIATGTGITPFHAMIEDELNKGTTKKLQLLFGLRHISHIFYQGFFDELAEKHSNFTYDMSLTKPENPNWQGKTGRVTQTLKAMELDPEDTEVYICGLKEMINEVVAILKEKGLPEDSIHFEKYD